MPNPRNLPAPLVDTIVAFAADAAYCEPEDVTRPGRKASNISFGRVIAAGIMMDVYGATGIATAEAIGVSDSRAGELRNAFTGLADRHRSSIVRLWERARKQAKCPTPKQVFAQWAEAEAA